MSATACYSVYHQRNILLLSLSQVKNKSANPVQITAEQLLREARGGEVSAAPRVARQKIADAEELEQYKYAVAQYLRFCSGVLWLVRGV
jgi:hypothetical protein